MFYSWPRPMQMRMPMRMMPGMMMMPMRAPLRENPTGAFPVPQSIRPAQMPPAVKESITRIMVGPPKPAVSLAVMNQTQATMISPDLLSPRKLD